MATATTTPSAPTRPAPPRTLRAALIIGANDLRRRIRDRSLLIQGVLAPIGLGLIVGLAFGGGISFTATIGVADADGSQVAQAISADLIAGVAIEGETDEESSLVFEAAEPDDVRGQVEQGSLDAALVLPAGLGEAVAAGAPITVGVVGHPDHVLASSVAEAVADSIAGRIGASRLAVASAVAAGQQAGAPIDPTEVAAAAGEVASPLQVAPVDVSSSFSVIGYFAPAMAMLFLFFTLGAGARSVVTERREGTLQRVRAAPITGDSVLVGKTVGVLVQGLLSIFTVWAVTALVFRVDWGDPLGVAAVLASVVVSIAGIALLITGLARTENQADGLTTIVALALAVVGGSFFFGAAGAVALLKPFTPNGQAMIALTELSAGEATLLDVLPSVALLLVIGLVSGALGLMALRRKVFQ
jgi:ABC-2 type transport system permease protein